MKIDRLLLLERQPASVLLAMLGWGEARGEGALGMLAVMHVALNRAVHKGKPLDEVILAPLQFSAFNRNDPNRDKLETADLDDPLHWGAAAAVAELALGRVTVDPTGGALNYYATSLPAAPVWTNGWRETAVIGNHVFGVAT